MPIYEYECEKCGEVIEILQKISDPPLKKCNHCGGKIRKLMSMNTFHLKGSGWYVTDYAGKKPGAAPKEEKAENKSSSSESGQAKASKKDD